MMGSNYTILDIYADYCKNVKEVDRSLFIDLCEEFNIQSMREIIENGREFNMGSYLSTIQVVTVNRNYSNPQVDWQSSLALKESLEKEGKELYSKENPDGEKWLVFFTNSFYCKFHWHKKKCVVKNKSVYRFTATRGIKGNKTKLKQLLNADNLQHLKYRKL